MDPLGIKALQIESHSPTFSVIVDPRRRPRLARGLELIVMASSDSTDKLGLLRADMRGSQPIAGAGSVGGASTRGQQVFLIEQQEVNKNFPEKKTLSACVRKEITS